MFNYTSEELHLHLLNMAKVFHLVCEQNNLTYYMLGGTMLGAVRHQGFIPWDDDMDFGMPRDDYNKFVEIASKVLPSYYEIRYFIENSLSTLLGRKKLKTNNSFKRTLFSAFQRFFSS